MINKTRSVHEYTAALVAARDLRSIIAAAALHAVYMYVRVLMKRYVK